MYILIESCSVSDPRHLLNFLLVLQIQQLNDTSGYVFLQVMGVSHSLFEHELETMKSSKGVTLDTDLTTEDLKALVQKYKEVYRAAKGSDFPTGDLLKLIPDSRFQGNDSIMGI